MIPEYWLPRPEFALTAEHEAALERVYAEQVQPGHGGWVEDVPVPKWVFLNWLGERHPVVFHGSGAPDIAEFQPRTPNDRSPDDFSKQTAVFGTDDGIWALFYAVIDRDNHRFAMLNGAGQFEVEGGALSDVRYFFSINEEVLAQRPWREGTVYILPRSGFVRADPERVRTLTMHEPHWASPSPVRPLAKLRVTPQDFPLLTRVRGHDNEKVQARAQAEPYGFPWLEK